MQGKVYSGPFYPQDSYYIEHMTLEKSADGRYVHIVQQVGRNVWLRLRIEHISCYDLTDFVAEVTSGKREFTPVGKFSMGIGAVAEQIEEMRRTPEEWPDADYPTEYGDEFKQMATLWERVLIMTEIGLELGPYSEPEDSEHRDEGVLSLNRDGVSAGALN
jgi:hypothetical protein